MPATALVHKGGPFDVSEVDAKEEELTSIIARGNSGIAQKSVRDKVVDFNMGQIMASVDSLRNGCKL